MSLLLMLILVSMYEVPGFIVSEVFLLDLSDSAPL